MKIKTLEYHNKDSDWQLAPTDFLPELTLLVGVSGVGKTRILRAVSALRLIAEGDDARSFWGVHWNTRFTTDDGREYCWSGAYEERDSSGDDAALEDDHPLAFPLVEGSKPRPKILSESLSRDGDTIFERAGAEISLRENPMPKLSSYKSVVDTLSEEDDIAPVHAAFRQILSVDHSSDSLHPMHVPAFGRICSEVKTLEEIRNCDFPTKVKLGLVHENDRPTFDRIIQHFMSVFPQVQEVGIKRIKAFGGEILQVQIKEHGVSKWIPEHKISSGMSRTLMHLSRMELWPDGMVVLIDEFENSLGVNCIDFVTDDLVQQSHRHQFIITSHHPYIINNIDTRNWKIVMREGSVVSTRDASTLGLEQSNHEAFLKLMNLPLYQDGIAIE